ncbi:methyltransferase-like protein 22 [Synchiropus splendidus]|uniref:methyltransferase-like protein 22 n=1 Tax=Synchiropus splendidus TaxID=270530 RepID=UPI00237E2164|nr:methyltransferase-like protein 22 [Synchiropus splendidus]XP_053706745.1 methyltransferase-like protein 22 [Synchiropus splendidus]
MTQIVFQHDRVLSDVHMLQPNSRNHMIRLNYVGQPVFVSRFKILTDDDKHTSDSEDRSIKSVDKGKDIEKEKIEDEGEGTKDEPELDEDGDFDVTHRPRKLPENSSRDLVCPVILKQQENDEENAEEEVDSSPTKHLVIEHTMATPLEDVGKQVWRGAILLADFILSDPLLFKTATVLDLGSGMGLTSIVMATVAKHVYCTDVGQDLLNMCQKNMSLNKHLTETTGGEVKVRQLDWLQYDLCTDPDVEFTWTEEEVADLYDNTTVIIAADICYEDDLTDAFFRTVYRLCSNFRHDCTVYISIEKRLNFTIRHMDVSCEAYDHFRRCLDQLQALTDGQCRYSVQQIPSDFPQFLQYERIEQLELWKVTASRIPLDSAKSDTKLQSS